MRKTFDAELQELNYEMIDMAAAAEDAIDVVTESLASGDDAAAKTAACACSSSSSPWPGICAPSRRP